jgi:hypothetical protein
MLMRTMGVTLVAVLGGCAFSQEIYLPDGSKGHNISCDGSANSMGNCFQKAGELCGAKGYYIVNREGQAIPFGTSVGSASVGPGGGSAGYISQSGMMVTRSLFIKCKE